MQKAANNNQKPAVRLGLALQGGGSYGAYTKGVLKALFEDCAFRSGAMEITAVTGTSAGAVNGALLVAGLNDSGPDQAIRLLDNFWNEIRSNSYGYAFWPRMDGFLPKNQRWPNLPMALRDIFTLSSRFLKGFVSKSIKSHLHKSVPDWTKLQNGPVRLFINAVQENPQTGQLKHVVFKGQNLTPATIAASGALRELGPVTLGGAHYYDGAYWRNPCLSDIKKTGITDLLVITLHRKPQTDTPPTHQDDLRTRRQNPGQDLITEEIHPHLEHIRKTHPHINLHVISLPVQDHWNRSSRINTDPKWLDTLCAMGYRDGKDWLLQNRNKLAPRHPVRKIA